MKMCLKEFYMINRNEKTTWGKPIKPYTKILNFKSNFPINNI